MEFPLLVRARFSSAFFWVVWVAFSQPSCSRREDIFVPRTFEILTSVATDGTVLLFSILEIMLFESSLASAISCRVLFWPILKNLIRSPILRLFIYLYYYSTKLTKYQFSCMKAMSIINECCLMRYLYAGFLSMALIAGFSVVAQTESNRLLNEPIDISHDFRRFINTYYLADTATD